MGELLPAPFRLFGGLVVWALHFLVLYVYQAVACARGLGAVELAGMPAIRVMAVAATFVALALTGLLLLASREAAHAREPARPATARFESWMAPATSALAGLGILYNMIPALMLPLCD
jgi:hypothetical protein